MARLNTTTTAGSSEALPESVTRGTMSITPLDGALWVNFGASAALNTGDYIASGQTRFYSRDEDDDIVKSVNIFSGVAAQRVVVSHGTGTGEE